MNEIDDTSSMDENFNYLLLKLKNAIEDHNYNDGIQKMVRLDQENVDEEVSQTSSIYDDVSNSKSINDENGEKTTITISRSSTTCTGSKSSVAIIYPCYLCNYETYRSTSLVAHLRQHRQGTLALETERFQIGKFVCNICNFKTRWLSSLKEHEQKAHFSDDNDIYIYSVRDDARFNGGPYNCRQCDFSTEELGTIGIHMRCHFTSSSLLGKIVHQYPCCLCEFITEELDELQDHFNTVHCNGKFNGKELLTTLPPSSRTICTKCDYIFTNGDDMISHLQKHDQSDMLEYPCDYCSHRSASIHLWRDHMEAHGGVLEISLSSVHH